MKRRKKNSSQQKNKTNSTLQDHLNKGGIYLDTFFLSLDLIEESSKTNFLSLDELKSLITEKRDVYIVKKHPAAKSILAEFKDDSRKNL